MSVREPRIGWRSGLVAASITASCFVGGRWLISDAAAVGLALVALGGTLWWRVLIELGRPKPRA